MKGQLKKLMAVVLAVAVILAILPEGFGVIKAEAASKVEFKIYTYGTNPSADCGAIIAPTTPGTYRVAIVQHGDYSYSSVAENMKNCMQKWVDEGLIEPMIIVTPYVIQQGGYNDHENFAKTQLPLVANRIKDGTFEKKLNCNIDKSKKIALTGYSFGGAVTAYGGMKYRDTFPYLGIISPSPFGLYPGGVWKDWIPNDPDTKDYKLTSDSDHLFMMFSGLNEPKYDDVLNVYYNEFGKDNKFTKVTWTEGYHRIDYFSEGVFYFLYTLQHGSEPTDSDITKSIISAWSANITDSTIIKLGTVVKKTVVRNGASIAKEPINGTLTYAVNTISQKVEITVGNYLRAKVSKDCNASNSTCNQESRTPYSYKWKRDGEYIDGQRKSDYLLTNEDVGHKITCEVSSITGKYSGCLTVTSETIKGNGYTPDPTPEPQNALSGTIEYAKNTVTGVVEAKYGFYLNTVVKNCNATSLSYQWKRGSSVISGATDKSYLLQKDDIGQKITCTVSDKAGKFTGTLSVTSEVVQKQDGPAAPAGLQAVNATKGAKDGKITGTSKSMEYSTKSDFSTKTSCTGSEITGLGTGTYYVRYAATDTQKHSNYATVTVGEKEPVHTHIWDGGKITTAATCTKDGAKTFTCTSCGITKTETIKAKGHTIVEIPAVAATCEKDGSTAGKKCSVCGTVTVAPKTVTKLGHSWDEGKVTKEATSTQNGEMTYACTRCKVTKTASIPAIGKKDGPEAPEGIATQDCSAEGVYDGKILKVTSDMEYSRYENFVDAVTCTDGEVVNLAPGTYYVRYKETEAVKAGKSVAVTIAVHETQTTEDKTTEEQTTTEEQKTTEQATTVEQKTTTATVEQQTENKPAKTANTETASAEAKSDGYQNTESITKDKLKKNLLVADKKSGGKFKVTKVTKKKGKVVGGTVSYMAPYNKNCTKATAPDYVKIAGVKFKVTEINKNAFKNCKKIKSFTVGKNVTKIGSSAFSGCSKLKSVTIKSKKLTKIGAKAFRGISKNAKFKVPKSKLFNMAKMIKSAKAPKNVKVTY